MKLTINIEQKEQFLSIDIHNEISLLDFKSYIESETNICPDNQILIHNSQTLQDNNKNLNDLGIRDDDMLILREKTATSTPASSSSSAQPLNAQIEQSRLSILNNPFAKEQIRKQNPQLYDALNDPIAFQNIAQSLAYGQNEFGVSNDELNRLYQDPENPDNQKKIMELIQQQQIDENMHLAYEQTPEAFVSVNMLYVDVEINGHKAKAFVDTGAQSTIISPKLAEKCDLSRLLDKRFKGEARGVGTTQILGKIHSAPMKIGSQYFPCSFLCLDTDVDLLLGLDMLRRHQATINLFENKLIIGDTSTLFLSENEIPKNMFHQAQKSSKLGGNIFTDSQPTGNVANTLTPANRVSNVAGASPSSRTKKYNEEAVQQLLALGFSRNESVMALDQCDGNVDIAASLLFQ